MATKLRSLNAKSLTDEEVVGLSWEARLVWAYLPCYADREGRMDDKPLSLRMEMLPMNPEVDMEEIFSEFARLGFITRYKAGDRHYIQIKSWSRYQRPYPKEPESHRPGPGEPSRPLTANLEDIYEMPMDAQQDATVGLGLVSGLGLGPVPRDGQGGEQDEFTMAGAWEKTRAKWLEAGYWSEEKQPMMAAKKVFYEKINFRNWPEFWKALGWAVEISKQRDERQYLGLLYTFVKDSKWKLQEPPEVPRVEEVKESTPEEREDKRQKALAAMGY